MYPITKLITIIIFTLKFEVNIGWKIIVLGRQKKSALVVKMWTFISTGQISNQSPLRKPDKSATHTKYYRNCQKCKKIGECSVRNVLWFFSLYIYIDVRF